MNKMFYKYFVFLDELNSTIKQNILKIKNINVIIDIKKPEENFKLYLDLIIFLKKNRIPFFIKNDYKIAIKYKADGLFLTSNNFSLIKPISLKKKFTIIGSAHKQIEYFKKQQQNCKIILLSPIFYNKKYSINHILNIIKFNLTCLPWKIEICALGGINENNIRKIKITKAKSIGVKSYIKKKPTYF
jgi:thiamine-phosphate pyrophosphorylase